MQVLVGILLLVAWIQLPFLGFAIRDMIGIGIMTTAVKKFYPKSIVLTDIAELPKTVMNELKRILIAVVLKSILKL